jgi:transcriptional regulator with XRE-family HTH domain
MLSGMASLARTVKRARVARGLTQRQVAQAAKVSQAFISQLEAGIIGVLTLPTALRLAKALKIDVQKLAE